MFADEVDAAHRIEASGSPAPSTVRIDVGDATVEGVLQMPTDAAGVVVLVDGPRRAPQDPGHLHVAARLAQAGFGTIVVDLLTPAEDPQSYMAFQIDQLAKRLLGVTEWLAAKWAAAGPIGYFGVSTGAAAALRAAPSAGPQVSAIVSAGGWSDLAGPDVCAVHSPTCFVVGDCNQELLDSNQRAQARLSGISQLEVIARAGHRFEEAGMIERVATLACLWFGEYLRSPGALRSPNATVR